MALGRPLKGVCMVPTNLISQILHDVCDNLVSVSPPNEGQPVGRRLSSQSKTRNERDVGIQL